MKTPFTLFATALVSLATVGFTPLAGYVWKQAPMPWNPGVSGVPGEVKELLPPVNTFDVAVYMIDVTENYDNPIELRVHFNRLQDGGSKTVGLPVLAKTATMSYGPTSTQKTTVGQTHHLTALQVCVNNDKIKGIRTWGKTIKADGTLSVKETYDPSFELPNCKDQWKSKVSCGEGKVVTGIRAHYKYANKGFSGLAIRCTEFVPKTP